LVVASSVRDHLLCKLKHVHSAKVEGNMGLSVLGATDGRQNPLGKFFPAVSYGVADRRIKVAVAGRMISSDYSLYDT
jgi:hypothetical protein